jgi:CDGSH-type Zn-finger protein
LKPFQEDNPMAEPMIADTKPVLLELEPGTYWWCACGRSANQPYCDGSHDGTGLEPVRFTIEDRRKVALCMCKHTADPPRCDGSHNRL